MTKKQHYMTPNERQQLEALYNARVPVARIARQLGFCRQTIYNEIKLGLYLHTIDFQDKPRYSAEKAEQIHREAQARKGRDLKIGKDRAYADYLERKIVQERYSPAAALAAARKAGYHTRICTATLYSYIEKGVFYQLTNNDLWEKSTRKKRGYRPVKRIAHPSLPSIKDRPAEIEQRQDHGHWEMDLVIGVQKNKACLLTLTERVSRQELIFKLPDRQAMTVRGVFDRLERSMGKKSFRNTFRSLTTDNGVEFMEYEKLRESIYGGQRFDVWYCHSYASWEKGTNENHNRMIRRFFPKGTDFSKITKKEIAAVQAWMNGYPRKILGWLTPEEVMSHKSDAR